MIDAKSSSSFSESNVLISASLMIEFWYCPRFIYFIKVLGIKQNEENRLKVLMGREVHKEKALQPEYLRKKIGVVSMEKNVYLSAPGLGICGIIDEVLHLEDGSISLLDYKFAFNKHKFKTQFLQSVFYAILLEENYSAMVNRSYVVYTREKNNIVEYPIKKRDKQAVIEDLATVQQIVSQGIFPAGTKSKKRCDDCTYSKICIK